uniref:Threonylcarbamoyl-AMP synthase n=1 Tax=Rhodosorus marinus TaxID=101924 RepID=A0A7S0G1B8_9RHOD|mmetsp:Transcript_19405/g.28150  ORF Transcript_19405/g.28150 Transcript_19405/m.28150 type:complete len:359 (+) Transcript_19405:94-1170(+)
MTVVLRGGSETDVALAASALRRGEVVAFPTETVYGLGADATNNDAVAMVYKAKGRPADNPLIVHMASRDALDEAGFAAMSAPALLLAEKFWPGPLTLVLALSTEHPTSRISSLVTSGLNTVAVRVPKHPVASALLAATGLPIAAPSANSSGKPSPTQALHVITDLGGKIHSVLDGGEVIFGIESTVLDTTTNPPTILRPGSVTQHEIEACIGYGVLVANSSGKTDDLAVPKAPGMKYRHYAPASPVKIVYGGHLAFLKEVSTASVNGVSQAVVGIFAWSDTCARLESSEYGPRVTTTSAGEYGQVDVLAQRLYGALRWLDEVKKVSLILAQGVADEDGAGLGFAVMNRLRKAALDHDR